MYSILSNSLPFGPHINKYEENFYLSCINCNSFCSLFPYYSNPAKIKVLCRCGYDKTILLSEYLDRMKNNKKKVINLCQNHNYQGFSKFCTKCHVHLCEKCIQEHDKNHSTINLPKNRVSFKEDFKYLKRILNI